MSGSADRRIFIIDSGAGGYLPERLRAVRGADGFVDSPRHADALLVIGPVNRRFRAVVAGAARSAARPLARVDLDAVALPHSPVVTPGETTRDAALVARQLEEAPRTTAWPEDESVPPPSEAELPDRGADLPSETLNWSLGPVQPFTHGPLELLLSCDGEQVLQAEVRAGYAHRGLAESLVHAPWPDAAALARELDPLAPFAGRIAFARAVEQLWSAPAPAIAERRRSAFLAVERALNGFMWLARFWRALADERGEALSRACAMDVDRFIDHHLHEGLLAPGAVPPPASAEALRGLGELVGRAQATCAALLRGRSWRLRLRGVGDLRRSRLEAAGVDSGPVHAATSDGGADLQVLVSRRIGDLPRELERALDAVEQTQPAPAAEAPARSVPAGVATGTADGPRGRLGILVDSAGGERPLRVALHRPSRALLEVLPSLLAGERVSDAELLLAALDLSMPEADG